MKRNIIFGIILLLLWIVTVCAATPIVSTSLPDDHATKLEWVFGTSGLPSVVSLDDASPYTFSFETFHDINGGNYDVTVIDLPLVQYDQQPDDFAINFSGIGGVSSESEGYSQSFLPLVVQPQVPVQKVPEIINPILGLALCLLGIFKLKK